jgi:hypothetical protein
MKDDPDTTRARLDNLDKLPYLTYRALSTQPEDRAAWRARQLVCSSLQTAAWAGLFSSNKRLIMQEFSYSFGKRLALCIKGVPFVSRPDHLNTYRGSTLPRLIP